MRTLIFSLIATTLAIQSSSAEWKEKLKKPPTKSAAKEFVLDKASQALLDLHSSLKELHLAGFEAEEVMLEGALSPKITVILVDKGSTGNEAEIIERNKDKKTFTSVFKLLLALREFKVESYELKKLRVEFGVPPKVTWIASVSDL